MRRPDRHQTEAPAHDSFLDVVANIVGILIILVMVTGVRAKQRPAQENRRDDLSATTAVLEEDKAVELALRRDVAAMIDQQRQLATEAITQNQVRMHLATAVAAVEHETEARKNRLDAETQESFRLRRELAESRLKLDRLDEEHRMAQTAEAAPILVESYPTPLSKSVDGEEIHFQLKEGLVVYIPLERLIGRMKEDVRRTISKLRDVPEFTDTAGPEGGFALRYTMVRRDVSPEVQMAAGAGAYAELARWTLVPATGPLGEPAQEALSQGSRFREVLGAYSPDKTTVTLWTYPDSFTEFRALKRALYQMGFSVAARPLPDGIPIGGSPHGTQSAAQ